MSTAVTDHAGSEITLIIIMEVLAENLSNSTTNLYCDKQVDLLRSLLCAMNDN